MSSSIQTEPMECLRDRDIFRDRQNRLFVVLGYIQPYDRILSYLKYVPDRNGTWKSGDTKYRRIFWGSVDSTVDGMAALPENYITMDTHFGTKLVEPPREVITEIYNPEQRLNELLEKPVDRLEGLTKKAAEFLHDELGISLRNLGVAGSILWKGHSPSHSDVNMNVYGFKESWALQKRLKTFEAPSNQARLRNLPEWKHAISRVSKRIPLLKSKDLDALFSRRAALCIEDRCIGITPVLFPEEAPIIHGSETYTTETPEPLMFKVTIKNAKHGIFHPAIYEIEPIEYKKDRIERVMVYDGAFGGLFIENDLIEVSGAVQKVLHVEDNLEFYQVMVGTKDGSGKEYIRLL